MKTSDTEITIGLDLGDKRHAVCVLNRNGEAVEESGITNTRESLRRLSKKYPGSLMVMEVGMQSPWVSRFFEKLGHRVLVANPRKVRAIYQNDRKSDRRDAEMLARLARSDEKLLSPIEHSSEEAQRDLLQIKLRDNLVRQRVDVILGPFGPDCRLKRKGLELAERGGPRAKKKAVVAVARKLTLLMFALWRDEALYKPLKRAA